MVLGDDLWDAHYLLITGYDDNAQVFTAQDPLLGPDQKIPYDKLMADWKPFNYLYMVIYLPQDEAEGQIDSRNKLGSGSKPTERFSHFPSRDHGKSQRCFRMVQPRQ